MTGRPTVPAPGSTPGTVGTSADTTRFGYRPGLDGLRAVAVLAVLAYHLDDSLLRGGFLGVDTFFVLSGYLITSLLLVEHARHGTISLRGFWARRARRLLPPALLLVAAVTVWGAAVADPETRASLRGDALAALGYVANWRFIASDQSYFDEFGEPSPLRHMWSLAIEEQFYLVWPLVVLAALALARGRARLLAAVATVAAAGSVVVMAVLATQDTSRAYYGTDARVHELLVGVLLAVAVQRGPLRPGRWLDAPAAGRWWAAAGPVALAAVLAAFVVVPDWARAYYRGGSLLFAVAVVVLIASVERAPHGPAARWLGAGWLVWLGTISYGLYLYHWPVFLWLTSATVPLSGPLLDVARLLVTLLVATASFHLLEKPVRESRWAPALRSPGRTLLAAALALLLTASAVLVGSRGAEEPHWADGEAGSVQLLGDRTAGAPVVAVVGDSIVRSLAPGLDAAGKEQGVTVVLAGWSGCGIAGAFQLDEDGTTPFEFSQACADAVPEAYASLVRQHDPDVVLLHSVRERFPLRPAEGGDVVRFRTSEHDALVLAGIGRSIDVLQSGGATVLLSHVVHRAQRFKGTCKDPANAVRCAADDGSDGVYDHLNALVDQAVARDGQARVYRMEDVVCPGGPPCATEQAGVILRWDGSHITAKGAAVVGPRILRELVAVAPRR